MLHFLYYFCRKHFFFQYTFSVVGIAIRLRAERAGGSNPGRDKRFFSSPKRPNQLLGPISFLVDGYLCSFQRVKLAEREAAHSPASSAEVKNDWSYTSTPPLRRHGLDKDFNLPKYFTTNAEFHESLV